MALQHIDLSAALRRLADRRIEDAMKEGKFDNLAGTGEPLDLEPMPATEDARLTWWCVRILKQNDYVPDEVRLRKMVDNLRQSLESAASEQRLEAIVNQINGIVRKVNTLGTNALQAPLPPLDLDVELQKFRRRR